MIVRFDSRCFYLTLTHILRFTAPAKWGLPILECVEFKISGDVLYLSATDRYRAAVGAVPLTDVHVAVPDDYGQPRPMTGTHPVRSLPVTPGSVKSLVARMRAEKIGTTKRSTGLSQLVVPPAGDPDFDARFLTRDGHVDLERFDGDYPNLGNVLPSEIAPGRLHMMSNVLGASTDAFQFLFGEPDRPQPFFSLERSGVDIVGVVMPVKEGSGNLPGDRFAATRAGVSARETDDDE